MVDRQPLTDSQLSLNGKDGMDDAAGMISQLYQLYVERADT